MACFKRRCFGAYLAISMIVAGLACGNAEAQVNRLPGSADIGRIKPETVPTPSPPAESNTIVSNPPSPVEAPPGADKIRFQLNDVDVEGVTAFSHERVQAVYLADLEKTISLADVYRIANDLTRLYRDNGYFLSLAYVPDQRLTDGKPKIQVVEGYVGEVKLPADAAERSLINVYADAIKGERPLKADHLESILLRLNDLPGYNFRAVLSRDQGKPEGDVTLTLVNEPKGGVGAVSFDNYSSRFLGPNQVSAQYSASLLPMQQTTVSALNALPADRLRYVTLDHAVTLTPTLGLDISGNLARTHPGFTLEPEDIRSRADFLGARLTWQAVRQRQENLSLSAGIDSRNTATDVLGVALTRDHIRALRLQGQYTRSDGLDGASSATFILSHGLNILNSSGRDDDDLSHSGVNPGFYKAELHVSRDQYLTPLFSMTVAASGQLTTAPVYSAEQFSYGGPDFGRAYDPSDLTGDEGVDASVEIQYTGFAPRTYFSMTPYAFYDIGTVVNKGRGWADRQSGASAGFGVRMATIYGFTANLGAAAPLTRTIQNPIYGGDRGGPRILLQIAKTF